MTLSYVYCIVRSTRRPTVQNAPDRMPGAADVRALPAGDAVWAIVSSVPASAYNETALSKGLQNLDWIGRRAVAHEAVVEHCLSAPAVLPMQLFSLFTSDERALEYVARERRRIDGILARLDRQLEWGLRASFDEKGAREAVERDHRSRAPRAGRTGASGAAYLARKRDLLDVTRVQVARARTAADRLYRAMAREATEARRRTSTEQGATPGSRLLLDAAFLVPARRARAFRATLRGHVRRLSESGLVLSLSGPWPAYNFVDDGQNRGAGMGRRKPGSRRRAAPAKRRAH